MRRTLLVLLVLGLAALAPAARAAEVERAPVPSRLEVGPFRTPDGLEVAVVSWRDASGPVLCVSATKVVTSATTRTVTSETVCTNEQGAMTGQPDHRFDPVSWTGAVSATARSSVFVEESAKQPNGDWSPTSSATSSRPGQTDVSLRWHANGVAAPVLDGMHYYCIICFRPSVSLRRPAAVTGVVRFAAFGDVPFGGGEPAWTEVSTRVAG